MKLRLTEVFGFASVRTSGSRLAGVVCVIVLLAAGGCRHTPDEVIGLINVADSIMEECPDSALAVLESVDTSQIHGKADRARYALLKSMAIDKNFIDTTTFSILQPAIDYYIKHGTPDQRLKTHYYEGRIHMNRGDDEAALTSFLKASEDSAGCTDYRALALVYTGLGVMYFRQYRVERCIDVNTKAAEMYMAARDTIGYLGSKIKILYAVISLNDTVSSRRTADDILMFADKITATGMDTSGGWLWYYSQFGTTEQRDSVINRYMADDDNDLTLYSRLDFAEILVEGGEYEKSLEQLRIVNEKMRDIPFTQDDSIRYFAIASGIYELNGQLKEALKSYKQYIDLTEEHYTYLFNSGILYTKEKHEMEISAAKRESDYIWTIVISSIMLLVCIIAIMMVSYLIATLRKNRQKMSASRNRIELQYQNLILDNRRLSMEKDVISIEMEKERRERENLELVSKMLEIQVKELESERGKLMELLDEEKSNDSSRHEIIQSRIDVLNDYIRRCITGNVRYGKELLKIERDIIEHKKKFLTYIKEQCLSEYPEIESICKEASLSERETEYVCLLSFGLSSKEIGTYLEINRVNHFAGEIRTKLNIPKNESTLSSYIKGIMGKACHE